MSKTISKKFSVYPRLDPLGIGQHVSVADLIDQTFLAYNGGRLREAAKLLVEKMLPNDGFIGLNLGSSGAQSVILMALVIGLTMLQFRFAEKRVTYR